MKVFLLILAMYLVGISDVISQIEKDHVDLKDSTKYYADLRDSTKYKIVKIGKQTWFAENLKYHKSPKNPAREDSSDYYYWESAKVACPSGWHLPTRAEWDTLSIFLGGRVLKYWKGNKIPTFKMISKETYIKKPNDKITNYSGFSALLKGYQVQSRQTFYIRETSSSGTNYYTMGSQDGVYFFGEFATFWAEKNSDDGIIVWLSIGGGLAIGSSPRDYMCNVRCVKD
jgi:uncharacterized protein (TIGR02145 family)